MCLAIPAKIIKIDGHKAIADFGGLEQEILLDLVDAKENDYVLVHVGYAIQTIDEEEAKETIRLFNELAESTEE
ncbi:MAG: HypC/HybG/HupF family hydrogenase formation chaperone [Methanocellales archaeon]|nr:HypC/HybG/HupF family hydrogenase formation chaperone [Methanocellales archaeon]